MPEASEIHAIIFEAIDELNAQRESDRQVAKAPETVLFGRGAGLDSLDLVNLIVSVEEKLADRFGAAVTLADERAMSRKRSPFRTVATLAEYVCELLASRDGCAEETTDEH